MQVMLRRAAVALGCFLGMAFFLLAGSGCGGGGAANTVTGKVTMGGKAVAGSVLFVGSDKKSGMAPINPDGTYSITPPTGECLIGVKGMPGALDTGKVEVPKTKADLPSVKVGGGVSPPAKYEDPQKSGLKVEVKGGKQTHDIELTP